MKEGKGKEEPYLVHVSLGPVGPQGCRSLEMQVQQFALLLCSFNDFFFLIGLMSLSLVLRAVSYFTLVPFHRSSDSNHFFTASWVGHLNS